MTSVEEIHFTTKLSNARMGQGFCLTSLVALCLYFFQTGSLCYNENVCKVVLISQVHACILTDMLFSPPVFAVTTHSIPYQ